LTIGTATKLLAQRVLPRHNRPWPPAGERIAVRVAPAMTAIARIASPVVSLLDISGRAVLRALGYQAQAEHRVTDEEIRNLMAEAETAGVIEPGERAMIAGVMRLGDRPVEAVMTPRREVDMIDLTADPEDVRRMLVGSIHSRLLVHAGTPEEMLGVVQAKDLLDACLRGAVLATLIQTRFRRSSRSRAGRSQWSGQRTGPWRRCPAHGYAGRCAIPGRAIRIAWPARARYHAG
jgi:Mg2+/Co2+ transporter CorB